MSNMPEDMFKKPKPMVQPIKLPNIPGKPTIPAHMQYQRPAGPNMPIIPNMQSFQNKPLNGQHQQIGHIVPPHAQLSRQNLPSGIDKSELKALVGPTNQKPQSSTRLQQLNSNITLPERKQKPNIQIQNQPQPNLPIIETLKHHQANIPSIIKQSQLPVTEHKDIQTDNTVLQFSHNRPYQPNIPNIPNANIISQSSRSNHHNNLKPQIQTQSNQNGFLTGYSVKGSTGIQIPPGATKLIINAVAGGGAGGINTETIGGGGGGAGAGVNGLLVPLNSLTHGTINVDVGTGGIITDSNSIDGTSTIITGTASTSNFSLTLGGGKAGSGSVGGISGNVQFFSKTVLSSALNGGDCNYKNCFTSGSAGGAGSTPGTKGTDGGSSLFQGGSGDISSGSGGGGASCFANGGSSDGQLGSGGQGGHNGGNGFALLEFYI